MSVPNTLAKMGFWYIYILRILLLLLLIPIRSNDPDGRCHVTVALIRRLVGPCSGQNMGGCMLQDCRPLHQ